MFSLSVLIKINLKILMIKAFMFKTLKRTKNINTPLERKRFKHPVTFFVLAENFSKRKYWLFVDPVKRLVF